MLGSRRLTSTGFLCTVFTLTFPLCAAAQRGDPAYPPDKSAPDRADVFTDSAGDTEFVKATPEQMRQVSLELLDLAEMFHEVMEIPISGTQVELLRFTREQVLATSDEDYGPLLSSYPLWARGRDEIEEQLFTLFDLKHTEQLGGPGTSATSSTGTGGVSSTACPIIEPSSLYTSAFLPKGAYSDAFVVIALIVVKAADAILVGLRAGCEQVVVVFGSGGNLRVACAPSEVAQSIFASVFAGIEEHQDAIVAHDIEAIHANVKALECLLTACTPVLELHLRGYGCNGINDNCCEDPPQPGCNNFVDECAEDLFGPEIIVDPSVTRPWYPSVVEGKNAILAATRYVDDCSEASLKSCTAGEVPGIDCGVAVGPANGVPGNTCFFTMTQVAVDHCENTRQLLGTFFKVDSTLPTINFLPPPGCFSSADLAEDHVLTNRSQIIDDNCTPFQELLVEFSSRVTHCNLRVTLAVTDLAGNRAIKSQSMIVDEENPRVSIDPIRVSFDATNTSPICFPTKEAAEAAVTAATRVTDNCTDTPIPDIACVGPQDGTCNFSCTAVAMDSCNQSGADDIRLRVDNTPPTITCWFGSDVNMKTLLSTSTDNKMFDPAFHFKVIDDCTSAPCTDCETRILVTSDEPTTGSGGASPTFPDASVLDDGVNPPKVLVRAEVDESDGRVYQIRVNSTDSCGNQGTATCHVHVPKGNNTTATDSGQVYDATVAN